MQYSMETLEEDDASAPRAPLRAERPVLPPAPAVVSKRPGPKDSELVLPSHFATDFMVSTNSGENIHYYASSERLSKCVVLCVHGAGFSGLSFAQLAYLLRGDLTFVCPDLRGHGLSTHAGAPEFGQLVRDLEETFPRALAHLAGGGGAESINFADYKILALGHSLGGSLASAVFVGHPQITIQSRILIDITEDTAVASLPGMEAILRRRPQHYGSREEVV